MFCFQAVNWIKSNHTTMLSDIVFSCQILYPKRACAKLQAKAGVREALEQCLSTRTQQICVEKPRHPLLGVDDALRVTCQTKQLCNKVQELTFNPEYLGLDRKYRVRGRHRHFERSAREGLHEHLHRRLARTILLETFRSIRQSLRASML